MDTRISLGCELSGKRLFIPTEQLRRPTCLYGLDGVGKSTAMAHLALHDVRQGHTVVVLDARGKLVNRLLNAIPAEQADRAIYLNPGNASWMPVWNPLLVNAEAERGRVIDAIVGALLFQFPTRGDREQYLLRVGLSAAMHLPGGCLADVLDLLHPTSTKGARIRSRALEALNDGWAKRFFKDGFGKYSSFDMEPVRRLLGRLVSSMPARCFFCQRDSLFRLEEVVGNRGILLVDLSSLPSAARADLGRMMYHLLVCEIPHGEDAIPNGAPPVRVYWDRTDYMAPELEFDRETISGRRVSVTWACRELVAENRSRDDMLRCLDTAIVFRVAATTARLLQKALLGFVRSEELVRMADGQAAVLSGKKVALIRTDPFPIGSSSNVRDAVICRSRDQLCRRIGS